MADTKISAMTAATDLTGAVIPIVQDGVNKKADSSLFVLQGNNNENIQLTTQTESLPGNLITYYQASVDVPGTITHGIEAIYESADPVVYNRSVVRLETSSTTSQVSIISTGSIKIITEPAGSPIERIVIDEDGNILMPNLPTASAGLTAGMIWNDGGTLKIIT